MDPATTFFVTLLCLQGVFVAAMILIIGRRFPRRLRLYRFVAPAALPILFFLFVAFSYVQVLRSEGLAADAAAVAPLARFALSYAVLWLVGVLFASLLIRLRRR